MISICTYMARKTLQVDNVDTKLFLHITNILCQIGDDGMPFLRTSSSFSYSFSPATRFDLCREVVWSSEVHTDIGHYCFKILDLSEEIDIYWRGRNVPDNMVRLCLRHLCPKVRSDSFRFAEPRSRFPHSAQAVAFVAPGYSSVPPRGNIQAVCSIRSSRSFLVSVYFALQVDRPIKRSGFSSRAYCSILPLWRWR